MDYKLLINEEELENGFSEKDQKYVDDANELWLFTSDEMVVQLSQEPPYEKIGDPIEAEAFFDLP